MNRLQKETIAHELREQGMTYREIGNYFGVSVERARQLVLAHTRREAKIEGGNLLLSEMLCAECNVATLEKRLRDSGIDMNPDEIAKSGPIKLLRVKQLGRKSVGMIAKALERLGKIDDATRWISGDN